MTRRILIDLSEAEFDALPPQQQAAFLEYLRANDPSRFNQDLRTASERFRDGCKPGPTQQEAEKRVSQHQRPDGTIVVPNTLKLPRG